MQKTTSVINFEKTFGFLYNADALELVTPGMLKTALIGVTNLPNVSTQPLIGLGNVQPGSASRLYPRKLLPHILLRLLLLLFMFITAGRTSLLSEYHPTKVVRIH